MKLLGLACCPVLLAVEVYRRGWLAPIVYGAAVWTDAIIGYRPTWTDEPEPI